MSNLTKLNLKWSLQTPHSCQKMRFEKGIRMLSVTSIRRPPIHIVKSTQSNVTAKTTRKIYVTKDELDQEFWSFLVNLCVLVYEFCTQTRKNTQHTRYKRKRMNKNIMRGLAPVLYY